MAAHSSLLAWRIPRTEEPGGPQSMGSQELDTTWLLSRHPHHHRWIVVGIASVLMVFGSFLLSWSVSPGRTLLTLCLEGWVCVVGAGLGAGSTSQLSGFSVFSRVILRAVPGLAQAGDLASRSEPRFARPESACGYSGVGEEQPPLVRGWGHSHLGPCFRPFSPGSTGPCAAACRGAFLQGPRGVGPVFGRPQGS